MEYRIAFVAALPPGHDFLLVQADGQTLVAIRDGAVQPAVLEDAWAAYRALVATPSDLLAAVG